MFFIDKIEQIPTGSKLIIPVLSDHKLHWSENRISFIYFYDLTSFEECVLGFNHNDLSEPQILRLRDFLSENDYCYKTKYLTHYNATSHGIEVVLFEAELVVWFDSNKKIEVDEGNVIRSYWNQFSEVENVNDCIPIMKWLEFCRDVKDEFLIHFKDFQVSEGFLRYNQFLRDLSEIEKNGLFTN